MQEQVYTWIADYTMKGRLAYLSHQETLTLFQRALTRARVPLIYSGGFNPRPHLSIPLPRSVGVQSDAERLCAVVGFVECPEPDTLRQSVMKQLPAGCELLHTSLTAGKPACYAAGYLLRFSLTESVEPAMREYIQHCVTDYLSGQPVVIQRYLAKKDMYKPLDIAPYVEQVEFENNNRIDVRCRVSQEGTVRVDELMQWLKLSAEHLQEPVRRMEIYWKTTAA
jgi:radical SAM-linked protein